PVAGGDEIHMEGRKAMLGRKIDGRLGKLVPNQGRVIGCGKEAWPGDRREGNGGQKFWIIAPARAHVGFGPALVKDIFAKGMALEIERHGSDEAAVPVAEREMAGQPAGLGRYRATVLETGQEGMRHKG